MSNYASGGEAPLPVRATARDVLYPLPLVALIPLATRNSQLATYSPKSSR